MSATRNSEPTVSIVAPCRNKAAYIEIGLKSVLAQHPPMREKMSSLWTPQILTGNDQNHFCRGLVKKAEKQFSRAITLEFQ